MPYGVYDLTRNAGWVSVGIDHDPASFAVRTIGRWWQKMGRPRYRRARTLAPEPRFLVCDEPVSALDVSVQASILNLLGDLRDELGLAYLFISHDLSVVAHLASRIAVMYQGAFCEVGSVDEVLHPPYHPYTQALLSAIPLPEPDSIARPRIRLRGDASALTRVPQGCRFHARCPKKLGAVCEEVPPPVVEPSPGHRIACHIPVDELKAMEPTAPVGWR